MKTFTGLYIVGGAVRRLTLEAESMEEARSIAAGWGVGIDGEADSRACSPPPIPEAYAEKEARRLLGEVSRTTLYRMLIRGDVERISGTRKVLVTRASIERFCRQRS